jgi:hypothetical protein
LLGVVWGCTPSGSSGPDAGHPQTQGERTLSAQNPPGDSIGLAFGASATLRVRYLDHDGTPLANAQIHFTIPGSAELGEGPRGSSLSHASRATNARGIAEVTLVAGSEATELRVVASAPQAFDATFYVTISDAGFASLELIPTYVGTRPASTFHAVEVRLFGSKTCQELDPAALPPSPHPPRSPGQFGSVEVYRTLAAKSGYTALAWGQGKSGHVLAIGCIELVPAQVRPDATIRLILPVADRPTSLGDSYLVQTEIELGPLQAALLGPGSVWRHLACQQGPVELLMDCAIDALDPGDPKDCVVEEPGADARALLALYDAPSPEGCQPAFGFSDKSMRALFGDEGGVARALRALFPALLELMSHVSVDSRLDITGPLAVHTLHTATLVAEGTSYAAPLLDSSRPLVVAEGVGLRFDGLGLEILPHGFTLRLGDALLPVFQSTYLDPLGVHADRLGTALIDSAKLSASAGCAALSELACVSAGLPKTCLDAACPVGVAALDKLLYAVFTDLDAPWVDLALHGKALSIDQDEDLLIESLGAGEWTAQIGLAAGKVIDVQGKFTGSLP